MADLIAMFNSLAEPKGSKKGSLIFAARPVAGSASYRVAKDAGRCPAILISSRRLSADATPPPVQLENLRVDYAVDCTISKPNNREERGRFVVVRCPSYRRDLHEYFLRVSATLIRALGNSPDHKAVAKAIARLVELFSALAMPPRKSVQGLWAELFLIARSSRPDALVQAWHSTPEDKYDFSSGNLRIEVKSVAGGQRRHHFTLEQLIPPRSTAVLVASVFTERAGGGISIHDLAERIRKRLASKPDIASQVDRMIALTLGVSWANAMQDRFDYQAAEGSLRFFHSDKVPSPSPKLPKGVSEVRFVADLTGKQPVGLNELRQAGGMFEAAVPIMQ